jgi:dTDP-4-dehydrorhamnose reductase
VAAGALTIRTSIIGRELWSAHGLIEWLLTRRGSTAAGFRRAVFSGVTTSVLAELIATVIREQLPLSGVWHVAGVPIAKHDLLALVRDTMRLDIDLVPDDAFIIDRSLDGTRFRNATGWQAPAWPEMIAAMASDPTPYGEIQEEYAH